MAYDQPVEAETSHLIWKIRFFEMGHTEEEIDGMNMAFLGQVIGYFTEKNKAEEHARKQASRLHG